MNITHKPLIFCISCFDFKNFKLKFCNLLFVAESYIYLYIKYWTKNLINKITQ